MSHPGVLGCGTQQPGRLSTKAALSYNLRFCTDVTLFKVLWYLCGCKGHHQTPGRFRLQHSATQMAASLCATVSSFADVQKKRAAEWEGPSLQGAFPGGIDWQGVRCPLQGSTLAPGVGTPMALCPGLSCLSNLLSTSEHPKKSSFITNAPQNTHLGPS